MAFIDEVTLELSAGRGGDGVVRWRHEKGKEFAGPSGGDGGKGGDVYALASRSLHSLAAYRNQKSFKAEDGAPGGSDSLHGKGGGDLVLQFPPGAVLKNLETGEEIFLDNDGEKKLLLTGGQGGYGNENFKSSINRSPKERTPGKEEERARFFVELRLFADIGLIGLPNAGKTSLLNILTGAKGAVADYPFTTLEPSLGVYQNFVIADIPGLIEGASTGKGLGHKFLRHIRRTKLIAHLISLENEDLPEVYKTIRNELSTYGGGLSEKEEIIILTKSDVVDKKRVSEAVSQMKKYAKEVYAISLYDDESLKHAADSLIKYLYKK